MYPVAIEPAAVDHVGTPPKSIEFSKVLLPTDVVTLTSRGSSDTVKFCGNVAVIDVPLTYVTAPAAKDVPPLLIK